MPPHCDSIDGPVVKAALKALDEVNVDLILPFVPKDAERELKQAFDKVIKARTVGDEAKEVADLYFCETVVRLHRAGEGAAFTGLKPAGLGHGPVVPVAEKAIETGSAFALIDLLSNNLKTELNRRFADVMELKEAAGKSIDDARAYTSAMLGFQVYSHKLNQFIQTGPHGALAEHAPPEHIHVHGLNKQVHEHGPSRPADERQS